MLPEVRTARTVRFPENFVKQKLENAPGLVGAGQVRSGAGPRPGGRGPAQVQPEGLGPWSPGRSDRKSAGVFGMLEEGHRYIFGTLGPMSGVPGLGKGYFWGSVGAFLDKVHKTKVDRHQLYSRVTGSGTSPRSPPASPWPQGGSAAMVPGPICPKLATNDGPMELIPWLLLPVQA